MTTILSYTARERADGLFEVESWEWSGVALATLPEIVETFASDPCADVGVLFYGAPADNSPSPCDWCGEDGEEKTPGGVWLCSPCYEQASEDERDAAALRTYLRRIGR